MSPRHLADPDNRVCGSSVYAAALVRLKRSRICQLALPGGQTQLSCPQPVAPRPPPGRLRSSCRDESQSRVTLSSLYRLAICTVDSPAAVSTPLELECTPMCWNIDGVHIYLRMQHTVLTSGYTSKPINMRQCSLSLGNKAAEHPEYSASLDHEYCR